MKTIFFIDDDQFVTTLYRTRLSSEGYCVEIANNGSDALEKLNAIVPDLIILDLNMPGINGVDVLKQIRARPDTADCSVIIFSNGYVQDLVDQAMSLGVSKVFTKAQCPPNRMMAEIKKVMESLTDRRSAPVSKTVSRPGQIAPNPLVALAAAADATWQTVDLTTLPDDASPETRRKALAGLYRSVRPRLNEALTDKPGSQRELLAKTLNFLFGDLYEHPNNMTKSSIQALLRGLGNLSRIKPTPSDPEPTAESALNDLLNNLEEE